MKLAMIKTITL